LVKKLAKNNEIFPHEQPLLGYWGNRDIDVGLATLDELAYIIGLVRQSLELQLGYGSEI